MIMKIRRRGRREGGERRERASGGVGFRLSPVRGDLTHPVAVAPPLLGGDFRS